MYNESLKEANDEVISLRIWTYNNLHEICRQVYDSDGDFKYNYCYNKMLNRLNNKNNRTIYDFYSMFDERNKELYLNAYMNSMNRNNMNTKARLIRGMNILNYLWNGYDEYKHFTNGFTDIYEYMVRELSDEDKSSLMKDVIEKYSLV